MSHVEDAEPSEKPLPTIWQVPDPLWQKVVQPLLNEFDPPKKRGRPRADQRECLDGILYRARTGCQWDHLPKEFGDDATAHRALQRGESLGIFDKLRALLLYDCEERGGVHWQWQAGDGCLNKARFLGGGPEGGIKRVAQKLGRGVKTQPVRTPQAVQSGASKTARLSRQKAARLLCASRQPM